MKHTAILIDPHNRNVRVVEDDFNDPLVIRQYLAQGGRGPLLAQLSTMNAVVENCVTYIDDFGCFREGQQWWKPRLWPFGAPGYALVCAVGRDGSTMSLPGAGAAFIRAAMQNGIDWPEPAEAQALHPATVVTSWGADGKETKQEFPVDFGRVEPWGRMPTNG